MKKIISIFVLSLAALLCFSACHKLDGRAGDDESTEPLSITASTEEAETSEAETESEALSEMESETAEPSTSKSEQVLTTISTTTAKVTSTVAQATTKKETTTEMPASTTAYQGTVPGNKYGVIITNINGRLIVDRTWYTGTYNELLPAARVNRNKYSGYISEVLRLTNQMRAEKGLKPLTLSDKLCEQACVRAEEVAWSGKHSHRRPDGTFFSELFKINGYTTGVTGENLGWGYGTASAVCEAWKASETHYANIMDARFVRIGIGVAANPDPAGKLIWVQHFYSE